MKTSQFRTNAKCAGCVTKIGEELNKKISPEQWSLDLSHPDKILKITSELEDDIVISLIRKAGFKAEKL